VSVSDTTEPIFHQAEDAPIDSMSILAAFPSPILVVNGSDQICYANPAAELFFAAGASQLQRQVLSDVFPPHSPVLTLTEETRRKLAVMSEYEVDVSTPKLGARTVNVTATPLTEDPGMVVLSLQHNSIASKMDRQLTHRGAARSVSGMAAMLAHEVKNPLSGIRGAAQLLEQGVDDQDRDLTRLICDETDRIVGIVERMEMFSDRPVERSAINIHEVLERVRSVADNGFGAGVNFSENYDPSLPPVLGNFDQLVQVFLNLVKNACEAVPAKGGEIALSTAFRHGIAVAVPGSKERLRLPIEVCVSDNGRGVPEDLRPYLFDAFVSSKPNGSGLGLALVAKLIGDHGGIIECLPTGRGTLFRTMLPMYQEDGRK
jgi:two-component system nitrogen regulation sensor histidine kinase GlnL